MASKLFALVYQCGIANLFDITRVDALGRDTGIVRVYQGDYRGAESIANGAILVGAKVIVWHSDVTGDCTQAQWLQGAGDLWAESKNPPAGARDAADALDAIPPYRNHSK